MATIKTSALQKEESENSDYHRGLLLGDWLTGVLTGTKAVLSIYELKEVELLIVYQKKISGKYTWPAPLWGKENRWLF